MTFAPNNTMNSRVERGQPSDAEGARTRCARKEPGRRGAGAPHSRRRLPAGAAASERSGAARASSASAAPACAKRCRCSPPRGSSARGRNSAPSCASRTTGIFSTPTSCGCASGSCRSRCSCASSSRCAAWSSRRRRRSPRVNATPAMLAKMQIAVLDMARGSAAPIRTRRSRRDVAFHRLLLAASGNALLSGPRRLHRGGAARLDQHHLASRRRQPLRARQAPRGVRGGLRRQSAAPRATT